MVVRWLARLIFTPYRAVPAAAAESTALSCLYSLRTLSAVNEASLKVPFTVPVPFQSQIDEALAWWFRLPPFLWLSRRGLLRMESG